MPKGESPYFKINTWEKLVNCLGFWSDKTRTPIKLRSSNLCPTRILQSQASWYLNLRLFPTRFMVVGTISSPQRVLFSLVKNLNNRIFVIVVYVPIFPAIACRSRNTLIGSRTSSWMMWTTDKNSTKRILEIQINHFFKNGSNNCLYWGSGSIFLGGSICRSRDSTRSIITFDFDQTTCVRFLELIINTHRF